MRTRDPIVVAGMHRSGTSFIASLLERLGVDMGAQQVAADRNNPHGYFEDTAFLELNRSMLVAATQDEPGHRDWGWTESEQLDRARLEGFRGAARELIAGLPESTLPWGWKDPRTTLLLDFWQAELPDSRWLLLYRFPWEVADSIQRLGADPFLSHPDYAYRIWTFYNRHLLAFAQCHRERVVLVSADALMHHPDEVVRLLETRWGLNGSQLAADTLADPALFRRLAADDPLPRLWLATHPECLDLLRELEGEADVPSGNLWPLSGEPLRATPSADAPRVTIVIPCYNHGEFLIEAVASVERHAAVPNELVVVNDGSDDARTLAVLETLRRAGYRVVDQDNAGLSAARNHGFRLASASYVLPLDADNRLRGEFLPAAVETLDRSPRVGVIYGDRAEFGLRTGVCDVPDFELTRLLSYNFIDACALVRKQCWLEAGGYDPKMSIWEDWALWVAIAERGWEFQHWPAPAFDYRVRPGSMVAEASDDRLRLRLYARVVEKHAELYSRSLPALLMENQATATELSHQARRHEAAQAAAQTLLEDLTRRLREAMATADAREQELVRLRADVGPARAEAEELRAEAEKLRAAIEGQRALAQQVEEALTTERDRLRLELEAWSQRVSFMEGTTAWRLRRFLLALRKRAGNER